MATNPTTIMMSRFMVRKNDHSLTFWFFDARYYILFSKTHLKLTSSSLQKLQLLLKMVFRNYLTPLVLIILLSATFCTASENENIIEQLTQQISQTDSPLAKSRLYTYRARQSAQAGEWEKAVEDYNQALAFNHQGWIHLERSRFLMKLQKYEMALEDAKAAAEETPTLSYEADKIIQLAQKKIKKQHELDNPPTIILDEIVDPYRKTRFDVMRERGVYAAKGQRLLQIKRGYAASNKTKQVSSNSSASRPRRG